MSETDETEEMTPIGPVDWVRRVSAALGTTCLPMWTVYDRPKDHPDLIIARLWRTLPAPEATNFAMSVPADYGVGPVRGILAEAGFVMLDRHPGDEPQIVETWM